MTWCSQLPATVRKGNTTDMQAGWRYKECTPHEPPPEPFSNFTSHHLGKTEIMVQPQRLL